MGMQFLYRISNNSYNKEKLEIATKQYCFLNFLDHLYTSDDQLLVIADNVNPALKNFLERALPKGATLMEVNTGSNGASFRLQLELAKAYDDEQIVMLHEDDYLYRPHPQDTANHKHNRRALLEALEKASYVSLYDHPDKYLPAAHGGNPFVSADGFEDAKLFMTPSSHWKLTNSTTLTFATRAKVIKEDHAVWLKYVSGDHPYDFNSFLELRGLGRTIATPIPGLASNTETRWLSPFFPWESLKK
jgi:hypothetical protein